MKLLVHNRHEAENRPAPQEPHVFITITNPDKETAQVTTNGNTRVGLALKFDDADRYITPEMAAWTVFDGNPQLFTKKMARDIKILIRQAAKGVGVEPKDLTVRVNCEAGQSRSAGIAAALAKYYNGDNFEYFNKPRSMSMNPWGRVLTPNMLVYRLMLNELEADHEANV